MIDKNSFTIQLAGKRIEITPMYEWIREYCKDYIVENAVVDSVDLTVQTSGEDIAYERMRSDREYEAGQFPDDYLETLAVYRKIAEWMPSQGTVLFHGSAVAVDGRAYLFTAKSGTGKSTHTHLWREYLGERAVVVNDDKPLLRVTEEGVWVCGTPWDGKHRLSNNICVPLSSICILKRGGENAIHPITASQAYPMLMQQCYRPADTQALGQTLQLLDQIREQVSFYELSCNMEIEAAEVAFQGMREGRCQSGN